MPNCTNCKLSVPSVTALHLHFKIKHKNLNQVFKCRELNCFRSLDGWRKFRRHLVDFHKSPAHAQKLGTGQVCQKNISNHDFTEVKATHDFSDGMDFDNLDDHEDEIKVGSGIDISSLGDLQTYVQSLALQTFSKLYANANLNRQYVQEHIEMTEDLLENIFSAVLSLLSKSSNGAGKKDLEGCAEKNELKGVFDTVLKPFRSTFHSEYFRLKSLEESGFFIKPRDFVVGDKLDDVLHEGRIIQDRIAVKAKFIPIRETLSKFLELPGVLHGIMSYTEYLKKEKESGIVSNFMQGELWEEKIKHFEGKFVLPIFIFYDGFEVNNPLGSHAGVQNIGGVYFSLPCLPPDCRSSLENIFLTMLFHESDRKSLEKGNEAVFKILVDELNYLQETGILVEVDGKMYRIYFCFGLLLGDNEGLNSALGFMEGFNANYYCRLCKVYRKDAEQNKYVSDTLIRTKEQYEQEGFENSKKTGVKEQSVWNLILYFHVVLNFCCDIMHDIWEGVCRYAIQHILYHYIVTKKYFTVNQLNAKILSFNYTSNGFSNKLPLISTDNVNKMHICMSASEMKTLFLIFPMLVCDLFVISETDEVWQYYTILREIIDILFAKSMQIECAETLSNLVSQHHRLYVKLFNDTLKPKHHNMKHYELIMRMCGPLLHLCCLRFESKHRTLKVIAKSTTSRLNITHTISVKEQLNVCYRFLCKKGLSERCDFGVGECYENLILFEEYNIFKDTLPNSFRGSCHVVPWLKLNGILYRAPGSTVTVGYGQDNFPIFGKIRAIILNENESICFVCDILSTLNLSELLHAYEVEETNLVHCFTPDTLLNPFLNVYHRTGTGAAFVTLRHHL